MFITACFLFMVRRALSYLIFCIYKKGLAAECPPWCICLKSAYACSIYSGKAMEFSLKIWIKMSLNSASITV